MNNRREIIRYSWGMGESIHSVHAKVAQRQGSRQAIDLIKYVIYVIKVPDRSFMEGKRTRHVCLFGLFELAMSVVLRCH